MIPTIPESKLSSFVSCYCCWKGAVVAVGDVAAAVVFNYYIDNAVVYTLLVVIFSSIARDMSSYLYTNAKS